MFVNTTYLEMYAINHLHIFPEEQGGGDQLRPDEQAQQGPSACSLEGKSISQVHQLFADLICAEKERARDAAEKVG